MIVDISNELIVSENGLQLIHDYFIKALGADSLEGPDMYYKDVAFEDEPYLYYGIDEDNDAIFYDKIEHYGLGGGPIAIYPYEKAVGMAESYFGNTESQIEVGDKVELTDDAGEEFPQHADVIMDVLSVFKDQEGDDVVCARGTGFNCPYVTLLAKAFQKYKKPDPEFDKVMKDYFGVDLEQETIDNVFLDLKMKGIIDGHYVYLRELADK